MCEEANKASAYSNNLFDITPSPHTYKENYITGIDFPVGPIGGSVIRMNGKAERQWWHIFNNWQEIENTGKVPNSFFAIRTKLGNSIKVRTLQTTSEGLFPAMDSLVFQGEYPYGWYSFIDGELPVSIKLEVYNPMIPTNLKDSSIPCAIYSITAKNISDSDVDISFFAAQQNAVGFDGYGTIGGTNNREFISYGSNVNIITTDSTSTSLIMTGKAGSMQLVAYETDMSYTASWDNMISLFEDFYKFGSINGNFSILASKTRLFHDTLYSSKIPRYILDRMTSQLSVLRSPTAFWTKDGYFGLWESTSNNEQWFGNCKHVYHYAQAPARLFPELGRRLRNQDLNTQTTEGLFPARDGQDLNALDGHFGTILGIYREHLLTDDNSWLNSVWLKTKKAMDYIISTYDSKQEGMLYGQAYHNTLDCNVSGTSPWIGSLYLASLKATAKMAELMKDNISRDKYNDIFNIGVSNQNSQLWDKNLGYYIEKCENLPDTVIMGNSSSLDMFLGQWWANQLDLGQIYPEDRTRLALLKIYENNKVYDDVNYKSVFRDFLGTGDTGRIMFKFPDKISDNYILYYNEVMSGFEYSAASTMLQYGMHTEGMTMFRDLTKRYNGRFRGSDEVSCYDNACVFGSGSPFGEDECGDFYGRPLSSWSALLALEGFIYDGPKKTIGFKPLWRPENHMSFFTTSQGWGLYIQTQTDIKQTSIIEVKYGNTKIKKIVLRVPFTSSVREISVKLDCYNKVVADTSQSGEILMVDLKSTCIVNEGSSLEVSLTYFC